MKIEKIIKNKDIQELIDKEFEEYEDQYSIEYNKTPFCFVAKENDELLGSISGYTCFKEIHISELIVFKKYRGKLIGSKLLKKVEEYFDNSPYDNINLCTYEFQAPEYYKKLGYMLEFIQENKKDSRLNKYYYIKYLSDK